MRTNEEKYIDSSREYSISKSNSMIQKAKYDLTLTEQKIILYIISLIKPEDVELKIYTIRIADYCKICGITYISGKNYELIKDGLKALRDKSFWVNNGVEYTTCSWVNKVWISEKNGIIKVRLDDNIQQYLIGLSKRFTSYQLYNILAMKSRYSIRLYELFKSYQYLSYHEFDVEELKEMLYAENYINFKDFRVRVLDKALEEINEYTDIDVIYETIKKGRGGKVVGLIFRIKMKDAMERYASYMKVVKCLNGENSNILNSNLNEIIIDSDNIDDFEEININENIDNKQYSLAL